jgi:hypothetical protein
MKRIRTRIQKRDKEKVAQVAPVATALESRPVDLEEEFSDPDSVPALQAKEEQGKNVGHSLRNISISAKETGEEEAEMVQAKEEEDSAELVPEEEEATPEVQAKEEEDSAELVPEEEEATPEVQAKEEEDSAELVPEEEEATPEVQAKEEEDVQVQSEEEDDLMQQAQELYEQLLAGDEAAIATLQEYGLNPENLQTLAPEEAISAIQEVLKPTVSD